GTLHDLDLHSFPTRRSSDLTGRINCKICSSFGAVMMKGRIAPVNAISTFSLSIVFNVSNKYFELNEIFNGSPSTAIAEKLSCTRSEEHTSELQSRFDLVCRL